MISFRVHTVHKGDNRDDDDNDNNNSIIIYVLHNNHKADYRQHRNIQKLHRSKQQTKTHRKEIIITQNIKITSQLLKKCF